MSATLTSRSPDLERLEAEGFRLRIIQGSANHLLIEGIPAVTSQREVVLGSLYCPLELDAEGKTRIPCSNHQCWWIGEPPCDANGRLMQEMISHNAKEGKGDGIETTVAFSRKRGDKADYSDLHEKIWTYVRLIWHEAQLIDPKCDPRGQKPIPVVVEAQKRTFRYPDMATTRAGIGAATEKLLSDRVAIIGLGGTGSYILDLLAKSPINEIHIFDGDVFDLHNAFRAPGAPSKDELTKPKKVDHFYAIYDRMHTGIIRHPHHVLAEHIPIFKEFSFVFVAIDDPEARKTILEGLIGLGVPFIDVGIDIAFDKDGALRGISRFTVATPECHSHMPEVISFGKVPDDDIYRNIQVADLNMLNASMAVMKWKKLRGFYADTMREHHSLYTIATHGLTKEDRL
ncbi:ThiF family adenylyltransferase [Bradyrhizobium erythrophlei]|uniref:ThiF family protein n=1 Tax=Bradyrhizobium erythrophlei TaxID=1437360 RepID=A0A1M5YP72_9BRAD|nr:ThiF family adenylyltransferase [Bradyrhizobium erythrophlei]SHI13690.1 ThiF family protein [Bradyrhizobium erythrophlei]